MASDHAAQLQAFITKWQASGAAERANAHLFISELCGLLDVKPPEPKTPDEHRNAYVFEKTIPGGEGASNFIDLYKRGHFILETKQGVNAVGAGPVPLSRRPAALPGGGGRGLTASSCTPTSPAAAPPTSPSPTRAATASRWSSWPTPPSASACACCGPTRWRSTPAAPAVA
jgi:hypothetical protein